MLKEGAALKRSFSLVELVIAMAVMAVAVICSLAFYKFCDKCFIVNPTVRLQAINFARETMERLYFLNYDDPLLNACANDALPSPPDDFSELKTIYGGTRAYTITQQTNPDYKVVNVTVTWNP